MAALLNTLRNATSSAKSSDAQTSSSAQTPTDVLSAVPPLPSQLDDVLHVADAAGSTKPNNGPADPTAATASNPCLSGVPPIHLHICAHSLPDELAYGLGEIARHAVRADIVLHRPQQPQQAPTLVGAGGTRERGAWWWNVRFERIAADSPLPPNALVVDTSADSFVPPQHDPAGAAEVQEPFVVTIRYRRACEAYRGLGHVLGAARSLVKPIAELSPASLADSASSSSASFVAAAAAAAAGRRSTPIHPNLVDASGAWALDAGAAGERLRLEELCLFDTLGTMIDCSRNGVLRVESVKFLCRQLALMGYNMLQLYTEETYKVPGEPFFGYLRGGYTEEELRAIDDYAFALGVEVIPCIQTLGHLGQMLQWPKYLALRDTTEVLLAEWPETYVMLEKMIAAATRPFRSKKIHLGMDETHGLGHGRYHAIFGQHHYKDPTRIFVEHLQRVNALCVRMGLQPMIWSDMLFCLNARNNSLLGYYDSAQPTQVDGIPSNMDLVYWDYYHTSTKSYSDRIRSHIQLGKRSPWMAAGSWTWSRFWTALPFTFAACRASQNASKASALAAAANAGDGRGDAGVRHVFLTIWGDEGNEVDLYSSLPAWAYYAEHAYTPHEEVDVARLQARFDGVTGGHFGDYVVASRLDDASAEQQTVDDRIHFAPNTSKWLLWEEPAFGFVSPSVPASGLHLETHFEELAQYLTERLSTAPSVPVNELPPASSGGGGPSTALARGLEDHPLNARLRLPQLLARVLALKAGLRLRLHQAYVTRDWPELERLAGRDAESRLARLRRRVEQLHCYHRQMWMSMYKPFGWEVLELRYGGLRARLEAMHVRVGRFLDHVRAGGQVGVPLRPSTAAATTTTTVSNPRRGRVEGVMLNATAGGEDVGGQGGQVGQESAGKIGARGGGGALAWLAGASGGDGTLREASMRDAPSATATATATAGDSDADADGARRGGDGAYDEQVTQLEEIAEPLHVVYGSAEQILDYHRVSRATYC